MHLRALVVSVQGLDFGFGVGLVFVGSLESCLKPSLLNLELILYGLYGVIVSVWEHQLSFVGPLQGCIL